MTDRKNLIGDTAIRLLAERGMRGLTHRAVDETSGLPTGSTSYYARTREALLELAVTRLLELDRADAENAPLPTDAITVAELTGLVTRLLTHLLDAGRERTVARYEIALEATRRPALRAHYDRAGATLRRQAAELLSRNGSRDPERHARALVAWCDGILFDSLAGAGGAWSTGRPAPEELRRDTAELLTGMLGQPQNF
ncbi:TetR family transcriptional regulator [Amycolatopsis acidicola]|uniref:TetR family transcriptional regulator n=1 Tax=Amycolatopsis acidicola TaxID=2596893 RepID=A0A5N0V8G0_9PSEU|nr:TetR/AcrR family transcriptional regulator [Amycolatopsis acidicola]KAA9162325.1 TetR family transcriptional regulator [Amycolatopsis acidicola]